MKYTLDKNGFYIGETKGQVTPHGSMLYPADAIDKAPPEYNKAVEVPKWDPDKKSWAVVESPSHAHARKIREREQVTKRGASGVLEYYLDGMGEVKPFTPSQITHNIKLNKIMEYKSLRTAKMNTANQYMLMAMADGRQDLVKSLRSYQAALVALGPSINADTDLETLAWPELPDISSVDLTHGEDLL